jgi:phosphate transport system protein
MSPTAEVFSGRIAELRGKLAEQGKRVRRLVEASADAFFTASAEAARAAIALDDEIDAEDVAIERATVALLTAACQDTTPVDDSHVRGVLNLVKVNNEYERIADAGVTIAERAIALSGNPAKFPPTTRVMTNSVVGILRDMAKAYDNRDATLARLVLQSEDTVSLFKAEILRAAERAVAEGHMTVDLAFDLHELASQCLLMADHATNVAEQVIYEATGIIVRHRAGEWIEQATRDRG